MASIVVNSWKILDPPVLDVKNFCWGSKVACLGKGSSSGIQEQSPAIGGLGDEAEAF